MYFMAVDHQDKDAEEVEAARVVPGENLGLEVVVDRHSNRQTMTSKAILPYDIQLYIYRYKYVKVHLLLQSSTNSVSNQP